MRRVAAIQSRRVSRRLLITLVAALVAALSVGLTLAGGARAAFPGTNDKIAFERDSFSSGTVSIITVSPDGSGLATVAPVSGRLMSPTWSADGSRLAFVRQDTTADDGIYVTPAGGDLSTASAIQGTGTADSAPSWSPDGAHLAEPLELGQRLAVAGRVLCPGLLGGCRLRVLEPAEGAWERRDLD